MVRWARRFWEREIRPVTAAVPPRATVVLILAGALLINKRYLADRVFGGPAETRWQSLAAWLLALLALMLVQRAVRHRAVAALLATVLGAAVLGVAMAPSGFSATAPWKWSSPFAFSNYPMLLLAWLAVAPAVCLCADEEAELHRPRAVLSMLLTLGLCAWVVHGRGLAEHLLRDIGYDKINWGLLTFGWLFVTPLCLSWGCLGGGYRSDGGRVGRWRFWLPMVVVLLAFMIALVVLVAAKRSEFVRYYPMYRQERPSYDPRNDGWGFFALYQTAQLFYFVAWEFFFRGWMLSRLRPDYGAGAIAMQAVPFVLMHIGKPGVELHSALVAGIVLGWLAWRGRTFWPCVALHWTTAAVMDLVAALQGPLVR